MKKILMMATIGLAAIFVFNTKEEQGPTPSVKVKKSRLVQLKERKKELKKHARGVEELSHELALVMKEKRQLIGSSLNEQMNFEQTAGAEKLARLKVLNERELILSKKRLALLKTIKERMAKRRM